MMNPCRRFHSTSRLYRRSWCLLTILLSAVSTGSAFHSQSRAPFRLQPSSRPWTRLYSAAAPKYSPSTSTSSSPSFANATSSSSSVPMKSSRMPTELYMTASTAAEALPAEDLGKIAKRLDRIAMTNALVVGVIAFGALYNLLHVDVMALIALWEYGLGRVDSPEITKLAVATDLLARLPLDAIHSYEGLVQQNPIFYKACTSGVAYALGDFISQVYQGKTLETLDLPRSARSGAAGFIGHGPLCHYWLLCMETYLDFDGAWWATGIKVTADLTVWSIFLNAAYSFIIGSLQFRHPRDVLNDVKATSWPALRSAWRFWPFVHTVSFSHAVPLDLKLLWVDVMEIIWVTILSRVNNEDKKQHQEDAVVAPETDFGVDPSLEVELTHQAEMMDNQNNNENTMPQKVLSACWPLIAMWPVLYAGYQLEHMMGLV